MTSAAHPSTLLVPLLLLACGIDRARDDFYEHHVSRGGASESTAPGESSSSGSPGSDVSSGDASSVPASEGTSAGSSAHDASSGELTSAADTSDTDTTAADPPARCGNGVQEPGEECDDANDDDLFDACTSLCARPRIIFITSALFQGGDVNTPVGADNRCKQAAGLAGLPEYMNYKALISDSSVDAYDRLFHSRGPYRLVNGIQVARDFDALLNDTLDHPVDTTELSTDASKTVAWTGTRLGGTAAFPNCEDWLSSSSLVLGSYGDPIYVDENWLNHTNPVVNPTYCSFEAALYCLEQE